VSGGVGLLLFAVLFLPELVAGRVFAFRDVANYHLPISRVVAAELRAGHVPHWNPGLACGTPLAANPNNYGLYPGRLLDLVLAPEAALTVHLLGHWLLGGVAFGALLALLACSWPAVACGTSVYLLAGSSLSLLNFANLAPFLLWVPLTQLAALQLRRSPGLRVAAGLAFCLAVQTTFAEPTFLLAEGLLLFGFLALDPERGRAGLALLWLAAAAAGALLIAAPMWIPLLRLVAASARGGDVQAEVGAALAPLELLRFPIPQLFGDYHTLAKRTYWGELFGEGRGPFFLSLAVGVTALPLAVAGFLARGKRGVALAVVLVGAVILAMGPHVELVRPLLSSAGARWFRWPVKLTFAGSFVIAVAVACGVQALASAPRKTRTLLFSALVAAVLGACALLAAGRLDDPAVRAGLRSGFFAPLESAKDIPTILQALHGRLLKAAAHALVLAGLLLGVGIARRRRLWPAGIGLAFLALLLTELLPAQRKVNVGIPVGVLRRDTPVLAEARELSRQGLRVSFPTEHWTVALEPSAERPDEWWPRVALDREFGNFYHPLGEGARMVLVNPDRLVAAGAAERARMERLLSARDREALRELIGVAGVVRLGTDALAAPGRQHWTGPGWPVCLEPKPGAVPIVTWLDALPEVGSLRPWGSEFVRTARAHVARARHADAVTPGEAGPGRWRLETRSERAGWVALTETHDAGWRAAVDGKPVRIERYLADFMAVPVPAGAHQVEWTYRPRGFSAFLGAAVVGLLLALVGFLWPACCSGRGQWRRTS
jgi:hypothetical protein